MSGRDTLACSFAHLLNKTGLRLHRVVFLPYLPCYTPTCNPLLLFTLTLALPFLRQTGCHGFQPTHYRSSHITVALRSFHPTSPLLHTGWQTGALHKDNVGPTHICVFVWTCVHSPALITKVCECNASVMVINVD